MRIGVSLTLAFGVLLVLLSPAVASPLTTLQHKHSIRLAPTPVLASLQPCGAMYGSPSWDASALRDAALATRGPDLLDLTRVRLC